MKNVLYITIFICLFAGCKKEPDLPAIATLPFENNYLRLELVATSLPSFIRDIYFFNAATGIAVSYDGKIYRTIDGGVNWTIQFNNSTSDQPFYQIYFSNANVGYVVGGSTNCYTPGCTPPGGLILKTVDGGNSWIRVLQQPGVEFCSITSNNQGALFALSNGTTEGIFKSTDAGSTWTIISNLDAVPQKINFIGDLGFCTGMKGHIFRSTDAGTTWQLTTILPANYATDIKMTNVSGYCIADNQTVYKTSDKGDHWIQTYVHQNGTYVLNPLTVNNCIAFGAGVYSGGDFGTWSSEIMLTENAGRDWSATEIKEIEPIRYTSFYSASEGYAVAANKLVKITVK